MKRILSLMFGLLLIISMLGTANADTIVDTGVGSGGYSIGGTLTTARAAEFTIDYDYTITSIKSYVHGFNSSPSEVTIVLYNDDAGEVPGSELLYSEQFSITPGEYGWDGLDNLSWDLLSGTYWVAVEPVGTAGAFFVPSPESGKLDNQARRDSGLWTESADGVNLSFQIMGDLNTVPIPSTIFLLGFGLLGLAGVSRKNN